ncbi:glycoside hydrolase family 127 protein [Parabacteroides sp. OttesenSCG-928-J18]|nr:glycoside hydrolase family 127 protein [Parabacteroides sp. OttesenSCG-928-J18]
MSKNLLIVGLLSVAFLANAQIAPQVNYFDLQDVRLLDGPFKNAENLDKQYLLEMEADRLLAPFLREAGLTPKKESYTNWENTGLDGHIGGHYVSALSLMYASTGDKQIKERLDYMLSEWKRCQDANGNGYIGGVPGGNAMWADVAKGNIRPGGFDLNGKWVPLYNIHKTYAGLRDAYLHGGSEMAKEMLIKMADWAIALISNLTDEQVQHMLRSEHGGLNETFADVAAITGDQKYLQLARRFSHQHLLVPLMREEDTLTGVHANTQIPKVLGYKRIADLEGNEEWSEATRFFWETVVANRSVSIGGNSVHEHFNPTDDFSELIRSIEGPETCNTYNMLRLSRMLYRTSMDKRYLDYYERAIYNHILGSQHPEGGGLVYFTQMRPGHYRVYSQPHTSMWCCVGSGIENHSKYGEMIYAHSGNNLYVNLFIPSQLTWKEKNVTIVQETRFPDEATTRLTIQPKKTTAFTLNLRCPAWVNPAELTVKVNGKAVAVAPDAKGFLAVNRKWKKNDVVEMEMPMHLTAEQLPDKSNYYSFMYGPLVLAAKTGTENMTGLYADDSRGGHIAHGTPLPLKDMPIVVSDAGRVVDAVRKQPGEGLRFTLSNLYSEKYPEQMELIPFFRLHDSRYIIYWPQTTKDGLDALKRKIEQEEKERVALDAVTIDGVKTGQQQPESDHFIQSENSNTGFSDEVHWRQTRGGWFSYQLKNEEGKAQQLYVSFLEDTRPRQVEIYLNDELLASVLSEDKQAGSIWTATYTIPENLRGNKILTVKFAAQRNAQSTKIVEVRLLENKKQ